MDRMSNLNGNNNPPQISGQQADHDEGTALPYSHMGPENDGAIPTYAIMPGVNPDAPLMLGSGHVKAYFDQRVQSGLPWLPVPGVAELRRITFLEDPGVLARMDLNEQDILGRQPTVDIILRNYQAYERVIKAGFQVYTISGGSSRAPRFVTVTSQGKMYKFTYLAFEYCLRQICFHHDIPRQQPGFGDGRAAAPQHRDEKVNTGAGDVDMDDGTAGFAAEEVGDDGNQFDGVAGPDDNNAGSMDDEENDNDIGGFASADEPAGDDKTEDSGGSDDSDAADDGRGNNAAPPVLASGHASTLAAPNTSTSNAIRGHTSRARTTSIATRGSANRTPINCSRPRPLLLPVQNRGNSRARVSASFGPPHREAAQMAYAGNDDEGKADGEDDAEGDGGQGNAAMPSGLVIGFRPAQPVQLGDGASVLAPPNMPRRNAAPGSSSRTRNQRSGAHVPSTQQPRLEHSQKHTHWGRNGFFPGSPAIIDHFKYQRDYFHPRPTDAELGSLLNQLNIFPGMPIYNYERLVRKLKKTLYDRYRNEHPQESNTH